MRPFAGRITPCKHFLSNPKLKEMKKKITKYLWTPEIQPAAIEENLSTIKPDKASAVYPEIRFTTDFQMMVMNGEKFLTLKLQTNEY
jgi:hypothetical protein